MATVNAKAAATSFLKDFQTFISRGNVIDLSVAVIVGAAFNAIVSSFTKDLVNPILGVLVGKPDFTNLFLVLKMPENYVGPMTYEALNKAGATVLGYGAFLTSVIQFLLLAFVIFCFLKFITTLRKKLEQEAEQEAKKAAPPPAPKEDIELLKKILEELKKNNEK